MDQDEKIISFKVRTRTLYEIYDLAKNLNTTPAGVISKALAMFSLAQGRTVEFKQKRSNVILETSKFADQPART